MTVAIFLAAAVSLAGSEWGLPGQDTQMLQFQEQKVSGHAGCNRFFGTYALAGSRIRIGPLATTRMLCPPSVMKREQAWIAMLERARRADVTHLKLILRDRRGHIIATLRRRDFD